MCRTKRLIVSVVIVLISVGGLASGADRGVVGLGVKEDKELATSPAELLDDPGFEDSLSGRASYPKGRSGKGWLGVPARPGYAMPVRNRAEAPDGERYVYLEGECGLHQEPKELAAEQTCRFSVLARGRGTLTLRLHLWTDEDDRRRLMLSRSAPFAVSGRWRRYSLYHTADGEAIRYIGPEIDTSGRVIVDRASLRAAALEAIPPGGREVEDVQVERVRPEAPEAEGRRETICFLKGMYYDRWRIEEVAGEYGRVQQFNFVATNVGRSLSPPLVAEALAGAKLVIVADIDERALGDTSDLLAYVRSGGAVLYLGGLFSFGHGCIPSESFKELLPVRLLESPFDLISPESLAIEPAEGLEGKDDFAWGQKPAVKYMHRVQGVKENGSVWLTVAGHPLLVVHEVGKGRVAAFTGTLCGDYGAALPFWRWLDWPKLLRRTISWLLRQSP